MINGHNFPRAEIVDFWAMVFNPSSVERLIHVWLGAFILGAFFVMSISAWYLLKGRHLEFAKRSFTGGLMLATICSLAQLASGHFAAKTVAEHQPAKLAAMEGQFVTETHAPMHIFGWPDEKTGTVRFAVAIPGMLSWLVHGDAAAEVAGFDKLEATWGRPPVWITFQVVSPDDFDRHAVHRFHALRQLPAISRPLFEKRWLLWYFVFAVLFAFAANEAGWVTAEVGRQPWIVYPDAARRPARRRTANEPRTVRSRHRGTGARLDHHVRRDLLCFCSCFGSCC